jgi:hypothetical protein
VGVRARARQRLDGAIEYTYHVGLQLDHDRAAVEARTLALRLLGMAKRGEANLDAACILSFGLCHSQYLKRTAERVQFLNNELERCIPDYDPAEARHAAMEKAGRVRRSKSFSGSLHAWEESRQAGCAE